MSARTVAFLSDYGLRDACVGICHAVIKRIDPTIAIVDIAHGIGPQDVIAGAIALADSAPFLPENAVVVAVVDPGVGGHRRAVAIETASGVSFVGPDNGLMAAAVERCGGARRVAEISSSPWNLKPVSNTFHGRDVFAPVAARLATGGDIAGAGQPLDPAILIQLELPRPVVESGLLTTEVLDIDTFGNSRLAAGAADIAAAGIALGDAVEIETGGLRTPARFVIAFYEVGEREPLVFEDSNGHLAVALNQGNAANALGLHRGDVVRILAA